MKKNRFTQQVLPIAMAGGLVALFAGCQVAPPATPAAQQEGVVGGNKPNTVKPGTTTAQNPSQQQATGNNNTTTAQNPTTNTQPAAPTVAPNAKVSGRVLDEKGNPIPGVQVNAVNGFKAVTDANGNYTIDVAAQDNLRLDFSKPGVVLRQEFVSLQEGNTATLTPTLKTLDAKVTHVVAAAGGTVTNSDGSSQLIIPPNALAGDADVNLTWLDPMPSDAFPKAYGQLPGALVTRTLPDGTNSGEDVTIPPIAFTDVKFIQNTLAPGAQATLRMRVNPEALKAAGDNIDFNNPATLQQPCYDYDRQHGLWVNPSTSKLEKDNDGTVWFVYTLRGADKPVNLLNLLQTITTGNYVTGTQTIYWTETETYQVWVQHPGGGGYWATRTRTVTRSREVDLYGKQFTGDVHEASSNASLNGAPLAGATVRHETDFFGGTTKITDGNGQFTIPMWHNTNSVSVSGSSYYNANSSGGGFNMTINTDSHLAVTLGGDWDSRAYGEDVTFEWTNDGVTKKETVKFDPTRNYTFGRDTADDMNNWKLVGADSLNFRWIPKNDNDTVSANMRPGDSKAVTIPMSRKAPK